MREAASSASGSATTSVEPGVEESEETYAQSTLPIGQQTSLAEKKVLGVPWDVAHDQLIFDLRGIAHTALHLDPTKRNVVSLIGQIYDPIGFLSPVTIRVKVLMQELCKAKLGWDQPLEGELLSKWSKLASTLNPSPLVALPRCYSALSPDRETNYCLYGL